MIEKHADGTVTLTVDTPLYRIFRPEVKGEPRQAVYFGRSGSGRFDLTALSSAEGGTAYWSTDPAGAFAEKFLRRRIVSTEKIQTFRLAQSHVTQEVRLLDITARLNFTLRGIMNGRWDDDEDYSEAQEIASAAFTERLGGIYYPSRRDLAREWMCVALFSAKEGPDDYSVLEPPDINQIPQSLVQRVAREFGIRVEDLPM